MTVITIESTNRMSPDILVGRCWKVKIRLKILDVEIFDSG